jgi:phospholipid N-methyltransferase
MLILNAYGFLRGEHCLSNANLIYIEISNAFCIQLNHILDKTNFIGNTHIVKCERLNHERSLGASNFAF